MRQCSQLAGVHMCACVMCTTAKYEVKPIDPGRAMFIMSLCARVCVCVCVCGWVGGCVCVWVCVCVCVCVAEYQRARNTDDTQTHICIHTGSTVGAVGAQSIGEPGTQMTHTHTHTYMHTHRLHSGCGRRTEYQRARNTDDTHTHVHTHRLHSGCGRRTEYWRARNTDDPEDLPFCGSGLYERDLGCATHQGDY